MSRTLQIDFVSDIACPWCAVGLTSLQRALERLGDSVDANITLHPFELNPDMQPEGERIVDYIGRKYGRTPAQIAESQAMIRERGGQEGFTFGERNRVYNTFDAHRLLHWARIEGKQLELKLALLRAYHGDGKDVSQADVLIDAARSVGLDAEQARDVLASGRFADEVRAEEREFQELGIQSVPAIIFDRQYLVSGGQPSEAFEEAIRKIIGGQA
ncbi:DsbA family oxidoreductase [Caballeronia sp. LZ033]|uniref:DsbA family oxidoreductase n=1 Tax=Caballeronia sp. LZ033 TaxID=3038566 RepID=UPI00285D4973|nr:DsbA family oxidoreductase [Caballeronia sp. LZ033]MDR5816778.1 DsbA family oxidoreductase [Caballeronia sp. LZ033]